MIFEHYAFDQYPYGANIKVTSVTSSISTKIGLGRIDFITSSNEPVSMTYKYEEINGTLFSISTNLLYTLDKKKHIFTLSNSNIFEDTTKKPYVYLLCNDVKVPISFFSSGNIENKWYYLDKTGDNILLYDGSGHNGLYVPKNITVGWNKSYEINLFTNNNVDNGANLFCRVDINYGYLNNKNKFAVERKTIFMSNAYSTITNGRDNKIKIPALNGISSIIEGINHQGSGQADINQKISITRNFYKYFRLGYLVRLSDGYSKWQGNTLFYVDGTNNFYRSSRIDVGTVKGKHYIESDGFPILNTFFSDRWNTDFFYTLDDDQDKCISPSSSEIKVEFPNGTYYGSDDYNSVCGDDYWGNCGDGSCGDGSCGDGNCGDGNCGDGNCGDGNCGDGDCGDGGCGDGGCGDGGCGDGGCGESDTYPYYSSINIPLRTYAAVYEYFESVDEYVLVGTYVQGTYDGYWDGYSSEATIYGNFYVSGTSSNGTNCVTGVDALSVVDFTASGLTCD